MRLWIIALLFAMVGTAHADATYTYTGNDFTGGTEASCPSVCSIDGSFTVSTPLAANFSGTVTPTSFDFYITDAGTPTWTNTNGVTNEVFFIGTNSSAQIDHWDIVYFTPVTTHPDFETAIERLHVQQSHRSNRSTFFSPPQPKELTTYQIQAIGQNRHRLPPPSYPQEHSH